MPYQYPFMPIKNSTQHTQLGAQVVVLTPPEHGDSLTLYVDNRGETDVLIEFDSDPLELKSFAIPARMLFPIGIGNKRDIRIKRPAGTLKNEEVITTFGMGI